MRIHSSLRKTKSKEIGFKFSAKKSLLRCMSPTPSAFHYANLCAPTDSKISFHHSTHPFTLPSFPPDFAPRRHLCPSGLIHLPIHPFDRRPFHSYPPLFLHVEAPPLSHPEEVRVVASPSLWRNHLRIE